MAGKRRITVRVTGTRELTEAEVASLDATDRPKLPVVKRFRDSHHMVARLFAMGLNNQEVSGRTGYGLTRVSMFRSDPAHQNLVIYYRENLVDKAIQAGLEEFATLSIKNMLTAERMLSDRLEEADETEEYPGYRDLTSITADRADRFGFPKRTVNTQDNRDFAAMLDKAIRLSGKGPQLKLVKTEASTPPTRPVVEAPSVAADRALSAPISMGSEVVPLPLKRRI